MNMPPCYVTGYIPFLYVSVIVMGNGACPYVTHTLNYEACPESKDTKVLNMYDIFNL